MSSSTIPPAIVGQWENLRSTTPTGIPALDVALGPQSMDDHTTGQPESSTAARRDSVSHRQEPPRLTIPTETPVLHGGFGAHHVESPTTGQQAPSYTAAREDPSPTYGTDSFDDTAWVERQTAAAQMFRRARIPPNYRSPIGPPLPSYDTAVEASRVESRIPYPLAGEDGSGDGDDDDDNDSQATTEDEEDQDVLQATATLPVIWRERSGCSPRIPWRLRTLLG